MENLMAKGADVYASGPLGTPLELLWRMANTVKFKANYSSLWAGAIRQLVEDGAVNNGCDPNGFVPSR